MKAFAIALLCGAVTASAVAAASGVPTQSKDTTALLDAAKDSKEKRKASTSKVITNKDVKKSKGKLVELSEKDLPKVEPRNPAEPTLLEKQAAERKLREEAEARFATAEKTVADLERELVRAEQAYFEENDPDVRDTVAAKRFAETKAKLQNAKLELVAARAARDATQIQ